ncbi:MAG: RagB/SusD family nutrient uptake outer membrane protein [Mangrovibacterium sp.]
MKAKYNKIGLLPLVLAFLISCTDTLELTPVSSITTSSMWKTLSDAQGVMNGAYAYLRTETNLNLFIWGEARSEVMINPGLAGTMGYDYYYLNTLNAMNAGPSWQGLYTTVNAVNLIIKYAPGINEPNEVSKNKLLAEAYTTRAYLYFVMARTWGGVPLRTDPIEGYNPEVTQKPRASVEEIFQLIKLDLGKAISLFGSDNTFVTGRNRWSLAAANALKADVYLWTAKRLNGGNADFTTAIDACNEVAKATVSLLPNFADLFEYSKKGNNEVIMAVGHKELETGVVNNYFINMYAGMTANHTDPINGEVIYANTVGGVVWTVGDLVKSQFTDDDTRKNPSFVEVPDWTTLIRKGRGTMISNVRYFTSDFVIYRYADVLLMKAEAKNALGQDPSTEMNQIRQRAYGAAYASHIFVNGSKAQNDDAILKERLLELVFEGKRWWDIVRFGKALEIVPSLSGKSDYMLLWPIGLTVLSLEPQVAQNPGWE